MARTTVDPKSFQFRIRLTVGEAQRLRKSAEELGTNMSDIFLRGLRLVEAEIEKQKRQAADDKTPA